MKPTKKDVQSKVDAYLKKFDEYDKMSLDELIALEKSGTIKGTYYQALINMIKLKQKIPNVQSKPKEKTIKKNWLIRFIIKIRNRLSFK